MSAASPEPLQVVPQPPRAARASGQRIYYGIVFAVVIATLVAIATWTTSGHPRPHGMRSVAPEQRAVLLSRTVEDLRRFCGAGHAAALDEHCRDLAHFAAQFDECRVDCEALVRPFITPRPTR